MNKQIVTLYPDKYPETLLAMTGRPKKLYLRGELRTNPDQKYLCVVGSRRWTKYGRDSTYKIISGLKGYPITIVSGLAIGIDSIAHKAALDAGLHCIAFPGSTLEWDQIYPRSHELLAQQIISSGGAIMSPWVSGYPTGKWSFPVRNTIMAGISHATLIVEAKKGSGSLMTAKHAEQYGRLVLAVPGSIHSSMSYGPHMLLRNGAGLITSSDDVLFELGFQVDAFNKHDHMMKVLAGMKKKIAEALSEERMSIEDLSLKIGLAVSDISPLLSELEIEGYIKISGGEIAIV